MDELELRDYFTILKRRRKLFAIVAAAIFAIAFVFALRWSNYRSTATVEVAPSEVSASTTIPAGMSLSDYNQSIADLRISHLQQNVLSTASLIEIITKFDLYAKERQSTPIADIADKMSKKVKLELVSSALANPSAAQKASANELSAIAFNLSFDYSDPLICQRVTNELVSRFLDEDLKDRRTSAHKTSVFLEEQIKVLEKSMEEQEKKIAEFRAAHGDVHPEALAFNQQAAQSVWLSIQNIDGQLATNETTLGALRSQLAAIDPYSRVISDGQVLTTPSIQLKALKSQYTTLSAQYGPEHPDVVKLSRQIAALSKQVGGRGVSTNTELKSQIEDARTNLKAAQKTYGPEHPDVLALKRKVATLEEKLAKNQQEGTGEDAIKSDADNPAYLQVVASLKSAEEQRRALMSQKNALLAQQEKYQHAVAANPEVEQKMASLSRDYDNAQLRFRELKAKKMSADMSESIEQDRNGQQLIVIDPPDLPLHTQPGRMIFVLAGFVLSMIFGTGSVIIAQVISQSVVGPRHLEALVGVAPLVIIPHITTQEEKNKSSNTRLKTAGVAVAAVILAAIIFSYVVMPLDVLWAIVGRTIGLSQ